MRGQTMDAETPTWPVDALCPVLGCGKPAARLVRSETLLYEYPIVGAVSDEKLVIGENSLHDELADSEPVGLVCSDGHHWAFPYLDYDWQDEQDTEQVAALAKP